MTADEFRAAYAALGLTQAGAGRLLGVDDDTARGWAMGDRDVPPPVARFLAFLIRAGIQPDQVMRALTPPEG